MVLWDSFPDKTLLIMSEISLNFILIFVRINILKLICFIIFLNSYYFAASVPWVFHVVMFIFFIIHILLSLPLWSPFLLCLFAPKLELLLYQRLLALWSNHSWRTRNFKSRLFFPLRELLLPWVLNALCPYIS